MADNVKRPMAGLALIVCLALLAAACGDDDIETGGQTPGSQPATAVPTEAPAAATPVPPSASPTSPPPTATAAPSPTPEPEPERATIDQLLDSGRVLNLAHAGGDQDAPHSTMFAFAEAAALGVDMLEIDVRLSGDGVLIVHHDDTVDRTTNGTGPVLDRSLEELQALDAAHWWSPECWRCDDLDPGAYLYRGVRTGEVEPPAGYTADDFRIITFAELVERFPTLAIDIEIKGNFPDAVPVVEELAALIDQFDLADNVVVVSFDDQLITAFEELAPGVEVSPGTAEMTAWILAGEPLVGHRIVQVPPVFSEIPIVTPGFMQLAAAAGIAVWVWPNDAATQENEAFYREMMDMGASGIIAGRPADMVAALQDPS